MAIRIPTVALSAADVTVCHRRCCTTELPYHWQTKLLPCRPVAQESPISARNLRTALNQAVRWGLVSRNAAALVDGPRVQRYEIAPFTPVEARRFLSAVRGHRLEALYTVSLAIGLR